MIIDAKKALFLILKNKLVIMECYLDSLLNFFEKSRLKKLKTSFVLKLWSYDVETYPVKFAWLILRLSNIFSIYLFQCSIMRRLCHMYRSGWLNGWYLKTFRHSFPFFWCQCFNTKYKVYKCNSYFFWEYISGARKYLRNLWNKNRMWAISILGKEGSNHAS